MVKPKLISESDVRIHAINVRSEAISVFITARLGGLSVDAPFPPADQFAVCDAAGCPRAGEVSSVIALAVATMTFPAEHPIHTHRVNQDHRQHDDAADEEEAQRGIGRRGIRDSH